MNAPTANLTHWAERVDMAAAFRWTARLNMHEAVANHFSLAVDPEGAAAVLAGACLDGCASSQPKAIRDTAARALAQVAA